MPSETRMPRDTESDAAPPVHITMRTPGGPLRMVIGGLAVVLLTLLVLMAAGKAFHWSPFGTTERDRSGPVVLTALRDLSEYHAASGSYQQVIDLEQDTKFVPDVLKGRRTLFLAIGSVDAYVDFRQLGEKGVQVSSDRRSVHLTLPRAQLARPSVDAKQSRVLDRNLGVLDRLGDLVSDSPSAEDHKLYALAEDRLRQAAQQSALTSRAEANTRTSLERLLGALGFTSVQIDFVDHS